MTQANAEGARQRRLAQSAPAVATQPPGRDDRAGFPSWFPVVLRSCDPAAGTMTCQRLQYKDNPPVVGAYEAAGQPFACYPLPTAVFEDYEVWVWPDTEATPITTQTVPMLCFRDPRGFHIIMVAFKIKASLLDPDEPANTCGDG